jgi:PBSX family phage portal protein
MSGERERVAKAYLVEIEMPAPNKEPSEWDRAFELAGALTPQYDPRDLCRTFERSSLLRPNVDAYEVNIERSGHRFEPTLKLDGADALTTVRKLLIEEARAEDRVDTDLTDADVNARLILMKNAAELELAQLKTFFRNCASLGFAELRSRRRIDLEATGNAYWEVLRDDEGEIIAFEHVETTTMRLMPLDRELIDVEIPYSTSECSWSKAKTKRRFRRYVQLVFNVEKVYFKELGDPRIISSRTNKVFKSIEALNKAEPNAPPATEILHWQIYSPGVVPYGQPRWIGSAPAVSGARGSEQVNANYWKNKGVPNGILSVAGGEFGPDAVDRIKEFFREQVAGIENFHNVLVLEVPSQESALGTQPPTPTIKFDPLAGVLQKDGIFQDYEKNCERKVGEQFRLPGLFRGDSAELNRATAETAVDMTNAQVFAPERQRFDDVMNDRILPLLGIRFWKFVSGPVAKQEPKELAEITCNFVEKGVLTINEGRAFASEVLGKEFREIDEDWAKKPLPLLIKDAGGAGQAVKDLVSMRAALDDHAAAGFEQSSTDARRAIANDEVDLDEPPPLPPIQ